MNRLYAFGAACMLLCMLTIPLISTIKPTAQAAQAGANAVTQPVSSDETVTMYDTASKKLISLPVEEYLIGVVACEMSASNQPEALKAQAVAAYTLLCKKKQDGGSSTYSGADISNNPEQDQGYIDQDARKEKWKDSADENEQKIKQAVQAVSGLQILYDGEPILAAYHAISGGRTEDSENVWGSSYPYLKPVESVGDLLAPDYASTVTYTKQEFIQLAAELPVTLSADANFISTPECTSSGTVQSYQLGGQSFTGQQMRKAFGLRSANFDLSEKDGNLVFTVRGYGHGVGMSQYGANYMAQQGSDFKEILQWYYTGCTIE